MTREEIVAKFVEKPSRMTTGVEKLSKQFKVSVADIKIAKKEAKIILDIKSITSSEYENKLNSLGIKPEDVKKVKFWDNMAGEQRFSITTKDEWYKSEDKEKYYNELKEYLAKAVKPVKIVKTRANEKSLHIHTSDKHVGSSVTNSIYDNTYNKETVQERMNSVLDEAKYLTSIYGKFDKIYFNDLGDALDGYNGQTTRGGHKLPQNMSNQEQFDTFVKTTCDFFDQIINLGLANSYAYNAVTNDNHSGDFAYCANRAIQIYLNTRYPEVEVKILTKFIEHYTYGNHTFMLTHGKDKEDMKHGLPLHMNSKVENFILQYIEYHNLTGNLHFIKGDLHNSTSALLRKFRYVNVLSLFGASKWIHNNFGNSNSGCSFDVVEKFTSRVMEHKLVF